MSSHPARSAALRSGWSEWAPLPWGRPITPVVLAETLDGGQAFRWTQQPDGEWAGIFGCSVVRLRLRPEGIVQWSAPVAAVESVAAELNHYFDLGRDPRELADALPWRSDPHLARCVEAFPGLRILRQPFGETLLGFLCSATKQIVQIKQMLALLAQRHGALLAQPARVAVQSLPRAEPDSPVRTATAAVSAPPGALDGQLFHRLPTWPELARIPEPELRACLLGFRARYIHQTAQYLAEHPGWLEETEAQPYPVARERLCSLPGVGGKIADCVLLFGGGRLEAFPVDVWIIKAMAERYGLESWKPAQVAHFGRVHFGALAGLAQQYLFAYERHAARSR